MNIGHIKREFGSIGLAKNDSGQNREAAKTDKASSHNPYLWLELEPNVRTTYAYDASVFMAVTCFPASRLIPTTIRRDCGEFDVPLTQAHRLSRRKRTSSDPLAAAGPVLQPIAPFVINSLENRYGGHQGRSQESQKFACHTLSIVYSPFAPLSQTHFFSRCATVKSDL